MVLEALVLEAKYIALDLEARSLQVSTSSRHFFGKSNSFELLVHHGSCQKSIGKDYRVTFCTTIYTLCFKIEIANNILGAAIHCTKKDGNWYLYR